MSQAKRGREKPRFPNSVVLFWDMVSHKAYLDLPHSACKELPYFLKKVKRHLTAPERYTDTFDFSYREARKYGFAFSTHHRTICQLIEKGIIDPVAKGGMKSDRKSYNRFRLSERWRKYGTPEYEKLEWATFVPASWSDSKSGNGK